MLGRPSEMLPSRVQIPDARTFSWIYHEIFRRYALSGKRRYRRRRGASDDFECACVL
jgi:hypothetical protein